MTGDAESLESSASVCDRSIARNAVGFAVSVSGFGFWGFGFASTNRGTPVLLNQGILRRWLKVVIDGYLKE